MICNTYQHILWACNLRYSWTQFRHIFEDLNYLLIFTIYMSQPRSNLGSHGLNSTPIRPRASKGPDPLENWFSLISHRKKHKLFENFSPFQSFRTLLKDSVSRCIMMYPVRGLCTPEWHRPTWHWPTGYPLLSLVIHDVVSLVGEFPLQIFISPFEGISMRRLGWERFRFPMSQ